MTLKEQLMRMLESELKANRALADTIAKAPEQDERSLLLFSHLLSSGSMWLSRLTGTEMTTTLFQERTLAESKVLMEQVFPALHAYVAAASDEALSRVIRFVLPIDGSKRKITVSDAIVHIVTHGTYHRGQIMARLKTQLDSVPLTTYIAYTMEHDN